MVRPNSVTDGYIPEAHHSLPMFSSRLTWNLSSSDSSILASCIPTELWPAFLQSDDFLLFVQLLHSLFSIPLPSVVNIACVLATEMGLQNSRLLSD